MSTQRNKPLTIGLVVRPGIDKALELGQELMVWAQERGYAILLEERTAKLLKSQGVSAHDLVHAANPVVSLGGDGTLISVARHVNSSSPVLIGVNFGQLGFLTEISPAELFPTLLSVLQGKAALGSRSQVMCEVLRAGQNASNVQSIFKTQCINDVVVQKGARDKLLDLDLMVDGAEVMRLRADGLIVATATGSTAYSLAAGGSIVDPELEALLVTPICAHSLTSRPLVLRLDAQLVIKIPEYSGKVFLSADGQVSTELQVGDQVRINKSQYSARFAKSAARSYFSILRTKLNWGVANRSE